MSWHRRLLRTDAARKYFWIFHEPILDALRLGNVRSGIHHSDESAREESEISKCPAH